MKEKVDTLLMMECTLFFQQNPYSLETVEGLSARTGRTKALIREVLQILCDKEILEYVVEGDTVSYRYRCPEQTTIIQNIHP